MVCEVETVLWGLNHKWSGTTFKCLQNEIAVLSWSSPDSNSPTELGSHLHGPPAWKSAVLSQCGVS